jgi:hypothetical protein
MKFRHSHYFVLSNRTRPLVLPAMLHIFEADDIEKMITH